MVVHYCRQTLPSVALLALALPASVVLAAPLSSASSRLLSDDPIVAGQLVYLDGADWALTSEPLPPLPEPGATLPNCTHPTGNVSGAGCCFANGVDWHNGIDGYGGTTVHADSPTNCCAACTALGPARCYVGVFLNQRCYLKTRKDAAGGNITSPHPSAVSCMPKSQPPPPPPPRLPSLSTVGTVPGDLISDLEAAGLVGDPYFENNFLNSSLWSSLLWSYTKTFTLPSATAAADALLVFEGIKMGAVIHIDGELAGNTTNQFRRYTFDLPATATGGPMVARQHTVRVTLDPRIDVSGRFMGCTGGWDWAPYSNTFNADSGALTFSSGIWKSVYAVAVPTVAINYMVPTTFYRGSDPTVPLTDGQHSGFIVTVKVFVLAKAAGMVVVAVEGGWGATNHTQVQVSEGETAVVLDLLATASQVDLWWPNGVGRQPLYNVSAKVGNSSAVATRRIGFRTFALVTGGGTPPGDQGATLTNGMYFRVNGASVFSKGANMIPMEELEGRMRADAHRTLIQSAAHGGMNTLRVWGGGIFLPGVFFDACDELGVMVYHDMMYPGHKEHAPANTTDQELEVRHNVRRLGHHPSIVIWDGQNSDDWDPNVEEVMTWVAQEDQSRTVWPACQSAGWLSGVDPATSRPLVPLVPLVPRLPVAHRIGPGGFGTMMEYHGPYQHAVGMTTVNPGGSGGVNISTNIPLVLSPIATGVALNSSYISEFGSVGMSSWESMSATLKPEHWGIHGGMPPDTCGAGLPNAGHRCVGGNPMAQRNYPCDSLIVAYFGTPSADLDAVGEGAFKKQLWLCMAGMALKVKAEVEHYRSQNIFGLLVWQLNEIWPTGGWGSVEYGGDKPGQVVGGRWKPLHYLYKRSIFTDVVATCGGDGTCYVKNDRAGKSFRGTVTLESLAFVDGALTTVHVERPSLAAGAGVSHYFRAATIANISGATHMLLATVRDDDSDSAVVSTNEILLLPPTGLALPSAAVTATVATGVNPDGSTNITVLANATALYVTLTTLAQGRFSDNFFAMRKGAARTVTFLPFAVDDATRSGSATLAESLRVEHLQMYVP